MKYLFFDIECCDGQHICEFGYVLIDGEFNILKRECLTINPEHKFNLSGRERESDITLAFDENVYNNSPTFPILYPQIKDIITMPDCQIIGFSMKNDSGFLATAYDLYGLEPIPFTFLDFQKLYKAYRKEKNATSIERILKELEIQGITLHKSDDDSFAVVCALQKICEKENLSLEDTLKFLKKINGNYKAEIAREHNIALLEKLQTGNEKAQREYIKKFISKLNIELEINPYFVNKQVCISIHFQQNRFNEYLALIEKLYNVGATYTGKGSECDIFIKYPFEDKEDKRLICAERAKEEGADIIILSLSEVLEKLQISEYDLAKKDYINNGFTKNRTKGYHSYRESKAITVGELLANKGIKF